MQFIDLKSQYQSLKADIDNRIASVLERQAFIQGPEVGELEGELAKFSGAKRVITCANGTDALQLALMALGIGAGDAVIVPSFTYTATAEVILLLGARPIFVDSDPDTFNIDFGSAERAMQKLLADGELRPAALMTVDLFGMPVDYELARAFADRHGLAFISDAAQGFGADFKGKRVGSLADITTTSFFPAKPLGCYGDGGAIFTDDDKLADVMRSICLHGKGEAKYDVVRVGVNSRLDTLQAAILLPKLAAFSGELDRRNAVAAAYSERLANYVQTPILAPAGNRFAWAQYTIKVENRDSVQTRLKADGIPSNVYYPKPMHLQPAYREFGDGEGSLPVAERLSEIVLSLPMHPYLTGDEIDRVADAVIAAVRA